MSDATESAVRNTPTESVSTSVDGYKPTRRGRPPAGLFGIPQLTTGKVISSVIVALGVAVTVGWYAQAIYASLGDLKDKLATLATDTRGLKEHVESTETDVKETRRTLDDLQRQLQEHRRTAEASLLQTAAPQSRPVPSGK